MNSLDVDFESLCPFGEWQRDSVRVDGKCVRVTATSGEYLVLGSVPRRKGSHRWEIFVRKKTPGTQMSLGIAAGLEDNELAASAQDTKFNNRIWHYCNSDGSFRNGARQVPANDQASKVVYGTGDRIVVLLDIEKQRIRFEKNAQSLDGGINTAAGDDFNQGARSFYLVLSLSAGDFVEVEESPYDLSYTMREPTYPWHKEISDNLPCLAAGSGPLKFSVNRKLPDGLLLDENTGTLSGTPSGKKELDIFGWRDLCFQMYNGKLGEQGWEKARNSLVKVLGPGLSDAELKLRARSLFERFDSDGSGEIEFQELKEAMQFLKVEVSEDELMHMAAELDVDGSAQIGFEEFENMVLRMYNKKPKRSHQRKQATTALRRTLGTDLDLSEVHSQCRQLFKKFDEDRSGRIDMEELLNALVTFGISDVTDLDLVVMIDELGIDQGVGDQEGLDFPNFSRLVTSLYLDEDTGESVWDRAKVGLVKLLGQNLNETELWDRTDAVFYELDEDKSGMLDVSELDTAMKKIGVKATDDELSRMIEEADVNGRLWVITVTNKFGAADCFMKITVLEGVSELQYASMDTFCRVGDKYPPLKVARLKGAAPFTFESIQPSLPDGMSLDSSTGTISGRPTQESEKTEYFVTARNAVSSTQGSFFLQTLIEPSNLKYCHETCIYKEGNLRFPAWIAARKGLLDELGDALDLDSLHEIARKMFQTMDADGSGAVSVEELKGALSKWQVVMSDDDLRNMIMECEGTSASPPSPSGDTTRNDFELSFSNFLEIVTQMYLGCKSGADQFKTDPEGDWIGRTNTIAVLYGTGPFLFTISPALPEGLSIDKASGLIGGVPFQATYGRLYTVKASNRVGETTFDVMIEVLEAPSDLKYAQSEHMLATIHPIRPIRCSVNGTRKAKCGKMNFRAGRDPVQARKVFDDYDTDGSGTLDTVEFKVMLGTMGVVFEPQEFEELLVQLGAEDGGQISFHDFWRYFRIGLPNGLSINPDDGTISGIPVCPSLPGMYTITCMNPVGEISTTIKMEVQEAPSCLRYQFEDTLYKIGCLTGFQRLPKDAVTWTLCELGEAFECNTLSWRGSKVQFSCSPPLPDGLLLNGDNGSIYGTPTTVTMKKGKPGLTEPKEYIVTGRNAVATAEVSVLIEVARPSTVLKYKKADNVHGIGEKIRDNEVIMCDGTVPYFFTVTRDPIFTKACFDKYDTDGSGSLDVAEFKKFIRDLGEKYSESEFRWLVSQIDQDKSGSIDYNEFWEWWKPLVYGLELDESNGTIYGRPLRRCEPTNFVATVWNKVGSFSTTIKIQVLDELMSRDRDADSRRQFWYSGKRTMTYPNGDTYDGDWENGKYHGFGIFLGAKGFQYEGFWRRGKRHGSGKEGYPDGMFYDGEYVDNYRHGSGTLRWPTGSIYTGEFQEGKRNGKGRQEWRGENGEIFIYDGAWEGDDMHGIGIVTDDGETFQVEARCGSIVFRHKPVKKSVSIDLSDGSYYTGEAKETNTNDIYSQDIPHGKGKQTWSSGDVYEGEYKEGMRHGHGIFVSADGCRYEGGWRQDKYFGNGILVQRGFASVVSHGDNGQLQFQTSSARVPVAFLDEQTLGFTKNENKLMYPDKSKSRNEQRAVLPLFPPLEGKHSLLNGYKDGTDLGLCYTETAKRQGLPEVLPAGNSQIQARQSTKREARRRR